MGDPLGSCVREKQKKSGLVSKSTKNAQVFFKKK